MGDSEILIEVKPLRTNQYIATLCCTMGCLAMGATAAYSSPSTATLQMKANETECPLIEDKPLSVSEVSWFSSIFSIGAVFSIFIGGVSINWIGRRGTMIFCVAPYALGWILIGLSSNYAMLITGRTICGLALGVAAIAINTYIGEIASPDIRGFLGTGVQVMINAGVLYVYTFGVFLCWQWLALVSLVPPIVFSGAMFFNKESPTFLLSKGRVDQARDALVHFRGKDYNVDAEMTRLQETITYAQAHKASLRDLAQPHIRKPLFISASLNILKQLTGLNAILLNLETIFESADINMTPEAASIVIAFVQVVATGSSSFIVDKAGRRMMLMVSACFMAIANAGMGAYFYQLDKGDADDIWWLPVTSLVVFMVAISIGYGPVPWIIMGEIFSVEVRAQASALSASCSGITAFFVTLAFLPLQEAIQDYGVYWLFCGFCVLGFLFAFFVVKETKGKTIEEITEMFGGIPTKKKSSSVSTS